MPVGSGLGAPLPRRLGRSYGTNGDDRRLRGRVRPRSESVQRLAQAGFGFVAQAFEGGFKQRDGEAG